MWVKELKLINFRNYSNLEIGFSKGINYIHGDNGSGKTSLVEAISLLLNGKSFLASNDIEMIKLDEEYSFVKIKLDNDEVFSFYLTKQGKELSIDQEKIKTLSSIGGRYKLITFLPKEIEQFKISHEARRKFVDQGITLLDKQYLSKLMRYRAILKNIKDSYKNSFSKEYIDVLLTKLVDEGISISREREKFIFRINQELESINKFLTKDKDIKLTYLKDIEIKSKEEYLNEIKNTMSYQEGRLTIKGIHHDDIEIYYGGLKVKEYGSQGQNRTSFIGIKLALASLIKKVCNIDPIMILDDVLSELDQVQQEKLLSTLKNYQQTFITSVTKIQGEVNNYLIEENQIRGG